LGKTVTKNKKEISKIKLGKTLGMLFSIKFKNALSTKAALNLGMNVMVMNFTNEVWTLEFEDGAVMNQSFRAH
jgi:N-succinyl-L-ornithine transcarbamylase